MKVILEAPILQVLQECATCTNDLERLVGLSCGCLLFDVDEIEGCFDATAVDDERRELVVGAVPELKDNGAELPDEFVTRWEVFGKEGRVNGADG